MKDRHQLEVLAYKSTARWKKTITRLRHLTISPLRLGYLSVHVQVKCNFWTLYRKRMRVSSHCREQQVFSWPWVLQMSRVRVTSYRIGCKQWLHWEAPKACPGKKGMIKSRLYSEQKGRRYMMIRPFVHAYFLVGLVPGKGYFCYMVWNEPTNFSVVRWYTPLQ